jgi:hypothetical protein
MALTEKIIERIKAKFPGINLSKPRLDAIAAKIDAKVEDDETKIDAQLDAYNDFNPLADIAKQDDTIRDLKSKVKTAAKPQPTKTDEPADEPIVDDTPKWAKTLMTELAQLKAEKAQTTIQSQLKEKLKDINPLVSWEDWKQPEKEDDIAAFVEKVQAKATAIEKLATEKGLGALAAPKTGAADATKATATSAALKATLEQQNKSKVAETQAPAGNKFVINSPGTL